MTLNHVTRLHQLVLALIALTASSSLVANEPLLFPISVEGKWGYISREGKVVIQPRFLTANPYSERLAVVSIAGSSDEDRAFGRTYQGFIDSNGDFAIPPEPPEGVTSIEGFERYSYDDFQDGLARIHINDATGVSGFINREGKIVIKPQYFTATNFSEGLSFVSLQMPTFMQYPAEQKQRARQTSGFINKQGQFVIENRSLRYSFGFVGGRAHVSVNTDKGLDHGLIDRTGNFVIQPGVYTALDNLAAGAIWAAKGVKAGLLDSDGHVIVPLGKFDHILPPSDGSVFVAESGDKAVLIDSAGKQIAAVTERGEIGRFQGGFATIKRDGLVGYIDTKGDTAIPRQFDKANGFRGGLALVTKGKTKGYINRQAVFVWETDTWDEPIRNAVSKPLSTFLPQMLTEALPLSYSWEGVNNAIVFVADGDLEQVRAWYKHRCRGKIKLSDYTDTGNEPAKIELGILPPDIGFLEVFAVDGTAEVADEFVSFYSCDHMDQLRKKHPKKIIGILIEN